jgi:hypothetical protein
MVKRPTNLLDLKGGGINQEKVFESKFFLEEEEF